MQLLLTLLELWQYLYFCTSKASKASKVRTWPGSSVHLQMSQVYEALRLKASSKGRTLVRVAPLLP
jgi:hypothetical protein